MKQTNLLKTFLLLLCAMVVGGSAWADSYTITFKNSANSASPISSSTGASTTIASASTGYVTSKPYTVNSGSCYYGGTSDAEKNSIRVGKSGKSANLAINLSDVGKVKATSIVVNCFKFNDSNKGTLAVNGMTAQNVPTSAADDLTFTFATATNIENIVLATTKATFIYSITVNISGSSKKAAELSFEVPSYKVAPNTLFTQTVTNPNNLSVTYESSDEDIAYVDAATGEVLTGDKIGTAIITASSEEDNEYDAGSATYTVTTYDPNAKGTEANPYSVTEALAVIDALPSGSTPMVYVRGVVSTAPTELYNGKAKYYISVDGTKTDELYVYNGYWLGGASFSEITDIAVGDEVLIAGTLTNYQGTTPEFNSGNYIINQKHGSEAEVKAVNITASKYKSYVSTENLIVPADVTAYIATGETASQLMLTSVDKIKANTPVVLFADVDEETVYSFEITTDEVSYSKTNLLKISDGTAINGVFVLAKHGTDVGFYKWAGGALSPGRVYVDAPAAAARDYLEFSFDETTALTLVNSEKRTVNSDIYNLAGQRVAQPTKGLYIVNGKKVIIK